MVDINYDDVTSDDEYLIKTPQEVVNTHSAICYDKVEFERYFFTKLGYTFKTYFAYQKFPIDDNPTHTFLLFEENNSYYWFENSWEAYRAVHGKFDSYELALQYVADKLIKSGWKSFYFRKYDLFDYKNMNIPEFGKYICRYFPLTKYR